MTAGVTRRALLVAVEPEPHREALGSATAELADMHRWLVHVRGLRAEDVVVCAGAGCALRTHGNRREEIVTAVRQLAAAGADTTDELYVFLSGVGFAEPGSPLPRTADWLATAAWDDGRRAGHRLPLVELQGWLAWALGPGEHFHLVELRRPERAPGVLPPAATGLPPVRSRRGRATVRSLVAVAPDDRRGDRRFGAAVRAGLGTDDEPPTEAAWRRLGRFVATTLPDHDVEVRCGLYPCPAESAGPAEANRASCVAVALGERLLHGADEPRASGRDALDAASQLHVVASLRDPARGEAVLVRPARMGARGPAVTGTHHRFDLDPAPQVLDLRVPGWQPLTLATCTLFGHATVLVVADDDEGRLELRQLILPLPQLAGRLPGPLRQPARALAFMAEVQRRLARGLPAVDARDEWERARWADLLAARWVDPILSLVAAYDLARRGAGQHGGDGQGVAAIVRALRTRCPGLPDTDVIAAAAGMEAYPVAGWPLFVDGMMAIDEALRPTDASLVCDGVWTMFRRPEPLPAPTLPLAAARLHG